MRTHIKDPSITVIMETVGSHQDKIVRSIKSVMAQTYTNRKLLIINYHPQRLQLCGNVPAGIEVLNLEDVYPRHVYQHINNLKQVDTDCWTICDDDDWIDPNHLQDMVDVWNAVTDRTDAPLQVCGRNYKVHYENRIEDMSFRGWAVSLFERLTPSEVDYCYKLFPAENTLGSDTWIAWNSYYDKREFDGKHSYHWDRIDNNHVSQHETNRGDTPKAKFEQALNFWRIKLEARSQELEPVAL